jgi:hypothetical protein
LDPCLDLALQFAFLNSHILGEQFFPANTYFYKGRKTPINIYFPTFVTSTIVRILSPFNGGNDTGGGGGNGDGGGVRGQRAAAKEA